jgi:alkylation response protein AidB-like acyl-CoA dehydrogenase
MANKFVSMRNLKFLLYEVFNVEELTEASYFNQHNRKSFDLILDAALKLGTKLLHPIFEEMDRIPPELKDGEVVVHPKVKAILKEFGNNGWISASFPYDYDGDQLPLLIANACNIIFAASNYSASVYPGLSAGAAKLILSFGNQHLKSAYTEKMLNGRWQGTMALTEPDAGSSLADITTTAVPTDNGYYKLQGQKIFISAGDHNRTENVVHLVLAKIEGAPKGSKGISLFVVPKKRVVEKDKLEPNDVVVTQVFHKLGYRGAPITELSFGEKKDCRAYLVGEENKGLSYMFQMMNEARLGVGLGATAIASAAYYAALEYSQNRLQGRKLDTKDPMAPQVPIIQHPDVKRMLLFQRSVVEGALSLLLQCCKYEDMQKIASDKDKERYQLLLDLLTPVAKTFPSEMGILSTSMSIQCFGGYGYCEDFPVEQHFRDMRIHPIHEGTTGIQAMDLLGRKIIMKNGKAFFLYIEEIQTVIKQARLFPVLQPLSAQLENALKTLEQVTGHLTAVAMEKGPEVFLADAALYLEMFGIITISWQWLLQSLTIQKNSKDNASKVESQFMEGKQITCRYYFAYELPKISALAKRLLEDDPITVTMDPICFAD